MTMPVKKVSFGRRYFTVYKPYGVLCQFTPDHEGQITLASLASFPKAVYPVGRLDADSEGLVILTSDNQLKHKILDPKWSIYKTYWCQVEGQPIEQDLRPLEEGILLRIRRNVVKTAPAKVRILDHVPSLPERNPPIRYRSSVKDSWVEIAIMEGKNRQVRRMLASIGFPVLRLVRVGIGGLSLGSREPGDVLEWHHKELDTLVFNRN